MIIDSCILQLSPDIRQTRVDGEGVVLNQKNAKIMVVNEVGIRLLELLDDSKSFGKLLELMLQEYETDENTLKTDLQEFIEELIRNDIVLEIEQHE